MSFITGKEIEIIYESYWTYVESEKEKAPQKILGNKSEVRE